MVVVGVVVEVVAVVEVGVEVVVGVGVVVVVGVEVVVGVGVEVVAVVEVVVEVVMTTTDWQTLAKEEIRLSAYRVLLAMPDPPELAGRRRYRWRYAGDPVRQEKMHIEFRHAYSTHRIHEARAETNGVGEESIVCVRRFALNPGERRFALRSGREITLRRES